MPSCFKNVAAKLPYIFYDYGSVWILAQTLWQLNIVRTPATISAEKNPSHKIMHVSLINYKVIKIINHYHFYHLHHHQIMSYNDIIVYLNMIPVIKWSNNYWKKSKMIGDNTDIISGGSRTAATSKMV